MTSREAMRIFRQTPTHTHAHTHTHTPLRRSHNDRRAGRDSRARRERHMTSRVAMRSATVAERDPATCTRKRDSRRAST